MLNIYNKAIHADWINGDLDTQYHIGITDDTITIKFQGSCSARDWWDNFSFLKKPYHNMKSLFFVHSGFLKKYKAVRKEILSAVGSNIDKQIQVLGYSQGSALAVLTHEDIVFNFNIQPTTYVFGSPRVFSIFNSRLLKKRLSGVTRVENGGDIVTGLPPFIMGFKHYGIKKHIGKKKLFKLSIKDHLTYRENI